MGPLQFMGPGEWVRFTAWLAAGPSLQELVETLSRRWWRDSQIGLRGYWQLSRADLNDVKARIVDEVMRKGGSVRAGDVVYRVRDGRFQIELPS